MKVFVVFLATLVAFLFSLMQIYGQDTVIKPVNASLIYTVLSVFLFAYYYTFNITQASKFAKRFSSFFGVFYIIFGFLLALICLYASPDLQVHALASAFYAVSSFIIASGLLFMKRVKKEKQSEEA